MNVLPSQHNACTMYHTQDEVGLPVKDVSQVSASSVP